MFGAAADTPSPRKKLFSKYAQSLWPESYSANVDILGQLHDILRFFNNCLIKLYFNPISKKVQSLFTFLGPPRSNRMSLQWFSLSNERIRIGSFGRRDSVV